MNILFLCDEYPPGPHGGIGTAVQLLARELAKQGHNVVVTGLCDWAYGQKDEETDLGVKVFRFRRKFSSAFFKNRDSLLIRFVLRTLTIIGILDWDIKTSAKAYHAFIEQIIAAHNINIVEMPDFRDYISYCKSYMPFPKLSVPTIVKLHGSITYFLEEENEKVPPHIRKMEEDLLKQATTVSSVSKYTAEQTAKYLNYISPIEVVYNGININFDIPKSDKNADTVVFTGSLVRKKGIYQLMRAWNIVHEKMPGAKLNIFGKGPMEKISSLLDKNSTDSVSFRGHVSRNELFNHLSSSMVAIFPSYSECFALAPMEAMVCNTAVIYTTLSSGGELITDGWDGLLVNPDDVEGMAEKIVYLLSNQAICNKIAQKGSERVRNNFNIKLIAQKNSDFYKQVLAKNTF